MEQVNLYPAMMEQLDYFIKKFISIGYKQEDLHYVERDTTDIVIHPDATNLSYKHKFGMGLYPELLQYTEKREDVITPWICCRINISPVDIVTSIDDIRLKKLTEFIKEDLKAAGLKAFYDEDGFRGNFTRPLANNRGDEITLKFYLNKDYPDGYWQNHTLD